MTPDKLQLIRDDDVILAASGTPLAVFQKERTDAISEMFDNVDECGIYPTGKFFARLDKCVSSLIDSVHAAALDEINKQWLSLDLSNANKKNWNRELNRFGLFMQSKGEVVLAALRSPESRGSASLEDCSYGNASAAITLSGYELSL